MTDELGCLWVAFCVVMLGIGLFVAESCDAQMTERACIEECAPIGTKYNGVVCYCVGHDGRPRMTRRRR